MTKGEVTKGERFPGCTWDQDACDKVWQCLADYVHVYVNMCVETL